MTYPAAMVVNSKKAVDHINLFLSQLMRRTLIPSKVRAMTQTQDHLYEEFSASDEKRKALNYVTEAFAEALLAGIEGDCFAHAALFTAFQELVDTYGEEAVANFAEGLPERVRNGEFTLANRH